MKVRFNFFFFMNFVVGLVSLLAMVDGLLNNRIPGLIFNLKGQSAEAGVFTHFVVGSILVLQPFYKKAAIKWTDFLFLVSCLIAEEVIPYFLFQY